MKVKITKVFGISRKGNRLENNFLALDNFGKEIRVNSNFPENLESLVGKEVVLGKWEARTTKSGRSYIFTNDVKLEKVPAEALLDEDLELVRLLKIKRGLVIRLKVLDKKISELMEDLEY